MELSRQNKKGGDERVYTFGEETRWAVNPHFYSYKMGLSFDLSYGLNPKGLSFWGLARLLFYKLVFFFLQNFVPREIISGISTGVCLKKTQGFFAAEMYWFPGRMYFKTYGGEVKGGFFATLPNYADAVLPTFYLMTHNPPTFSEDVSLFSI